MENFIDDNLAYARLKPPCECGCLAHCGFKCVSENCGCEQCRCVACLSQIMTKIGATDI